MNRKDKRILNKGFKKLSKSLKRMDEGQISKTLLNLVETTYETDVEYFKEILKNTEGIGPILYDRIASQLKGEEDEE